MKCPVDGTTLAMSDRNGVEIDYCPTCRGVWLDRGELDKIIERSYEEPVQLAEPTPPPPPSRPVAPQPPVQNHGGYDEHTRYEKPRRKKKKGGFLEEIFDFLD